MNARILSLFCESDIYFNRMHVSRGNETDLREKEREREERRSKGREEERKRGRMDESDRDEVVGGEGGGGRDGGGENCTCRRMRKVEGVEGEGNKREKDKIR